MRGVAAGRSLVHSDGGLFVACTSWVPSRRALVHPGGGCFVAGRGWLPPRARTRPSGRRLFRSRRGLGSLPGAHTCGCTAAGVAWNLFSCRGSLRVVGALRVCGTRRPLLLGTCPCALVVAGGMPLWRASCPRVVRRASSGLVALGALEGFPGALVPFPTPEACAPGFTGWLRRACGGRPRTALIVPAAGRNADSSTTVHNPKTPLRGKKPFQRHPLALRTGQVSQQVPRDPRQHALTVSCVRFCVLRSALPSQGGVHAHMEACPF